MIFPVPTSWLYTLKKQKCTYHTNGVICDTVGVLITQLRVIGTPKCYTTSLNTVCITWSHYNGVLYGVVRVPIIQIKV